LDEINFFKSNQKIRKIKNLYEDRITDDNIIINPCLGDPSNRTVNSGSFMSEKAFLKPYECYFPSSQTHGYQIAGPRLHIALKPTDTVIAISTSGGLCPGLNVVIRELVMSAWYNYGVRKIFGIKWGYEGAVSVENWIELTPNLVRDIHREGGTILGTCRCELNAKAIVDNLIANKVNVFFSIGGDGTHKGLKALSEELSNRDEKIILAGIPKTIDNDIPLIDRSFGFETAIQQAVNCIQVANVEANSTKNGVGLVRVFGRSCGFIALEASKASRDVNICLIPESPFNLYGEKGLLKFIFNRLAIKNHCVIVVAEGSASAILDYKVNFSSQTDKSGNPVLPDIGDILKKEIKEYAKSNNLEVTLKYLDPTYTIRGCPANSFDINYCA
jgi:6-phosphofructokinase 1